MSKSKLNTSKAAVGIKTETTTAVEQAPTLDDSGASAEAAIVIEYEVISPLHYNRKRYSIGDTVHLSDEFATGLIGRVIKHIEQTTIKHSPND